MTIKEIRLLSGLSQAAFGQKYGIPKRSIGNWEMGARDCPDYLKALLERVVREDFGTENSEGTDKAVSQKTINANDQKF